METENKVSIKVGTVVPCVEKNGKIASWKRPDGWGMFF